MAAPAKTRIVLLGKTGSGKSSVGNVILGEEKFKAESDPNSVSIDCQTEEGNLNGRRISVTDTPGIFDTDASRSEEDLKDSIISCLTECAPGPHVFILVMRVGRYTKEEKESVKMILECFGEEALKHTGKNQTIKEFVERSKDLKELVDKCGGRVHVVDSKHWNKKYGQSEDLPKEMIKQKRAAGKSHFRFRFRFRLKQRSSTPDKEPSQESGRPSSSGGNQGGSEYRSNSFQIKQLLTTIDIMVKNNDGDHYTNKTLQVTAEAIENQVNKINKEMEEKGEKAEESEIRRRARERVRTETRRLIAGSATGAVLGALLGVPVGLTIAAILAAQLTMMSFTRAVGAGTAGAEGGAGAAIVSGVYVAVGTLAAVGGVMGGAVGAKAAARADTVGEAAGNAAEAVVKGAWNMVQEACEFPKKMASQ